MRITTSTTAPERATADVLAVTVGKPVALTGAAAAVDRALGGRLTRLVDAGEIRRSKGQVTVVHADGGVRAKRVAVVGIGKTPGSAEVRLAAAAAVRAAGGARAKSVAFALAGVPLEAAKATRCVVDGAALAGYRFTRYLTGPADDRPGEVGSGRAGRRPGAGPPLGRPHGSDQPGRPQNALTRHGAAGLADRAREQGSPTLTRPCRPGWMERRGMGLFWPWPGSSKPPLTIVLRHKPRRPNDASCWPRRQGLTYHSGGYTLKPAALVGMKFDFGRRGGVGDRRHRRLGLPSSGHDRATGT
jgi:leucyl aminopeptidase